MIRDIVGLFIRNKNLNMNTWTWLLPLLSGTLGALIGTYLGSRFLSWKQEQKIRNVRATAVKALEVFKSYAKHKKFSDAENEFNNKLNVSEKRAVVVSLHKLGVPFTIPTRDSLNVNTLHFNNVEIDKDDIESMISQINKGNCDNLFFEDIETYFNSNIRLYAVRSVGKKYVEEVLSRGHIDKENPNTIIYPIEWFKKFSPGELQTIMVIHMQLANINYFTPEGTANKKAIDTLLREIEIGLWDSYLFFEYESFQNIKAQSNLANLVQAVLTNQQMMINNTI